MEKNWGVRKGEMSEIVANINKLEKCWHVESWFSTFHSFKNNLKGGFSFGYTGGHNKIRIQQWIDLFPGRAQSGLKVDD